MLLFWMTIGRNEWRKSTASRPVNESASYQINFIDVWEFMTLWLFSSELIKEHRNKILWDFQIIFN
jgi:hypothetical protein